MRKHQKLAIFLKRCRESAHSIEFWILPLNFVLQGVPEKTEPELLIL